MRRDEQLDDMERTISRLRMDNDAMQNEIKNWRGERDQIRQALEDARTQLAATGCPLCTYINGAVTKSCALHAEVAQLKGDIVKVVEADASEVRNLKLQNGELKAALQMMLVRYPASTFCDVDCSNGSCEYCQLERLMKDVLLGKTEKRNDEPSGRRPEPPDYSDTGNENASQR